MCNVFCFASRQIIYYILIRFLCLPQVFPNHLTSLSANFIFFLSLKNKNENQNDEKKTVRQKKKNTNTIVLCQSTSGYGIKCVAAIKRVHFYKNAVEFRIYACTCVLMWIYLDTQCTKICFGDSLQEVLTNYTSVGVFLCVCRQMVKGMETECRGSGGECFPHSFEMKIVLV